MIENKADALYLVPESKLEEILNTLSEIKAYYKKLTESPMASDSEIFDNKAAAAFLKVSTKTLKKYRDERLIAFSQCGRKIHYLRSDLVKFLESHKLRVR